MSKKNDERQKRRLTPQQMEQAFKKADADGDGKLDKEEFLSLMRRQGLNLNGREGEDFFRDRDKDLDGKICLDEFMGRVRRWD